MLLAVGSTVIPASQQSFWMCDRLTVKGDKGKTAHWLHFFESEFLSSIGAVTSVQKDAKFEEIQPVYRYLSSLLIIAVYSFPKITVLVYSTI